MTAKVGRARYEKEKGIGHVNPGSVSVAIIFRTLKEGIAAGRNSQTEPLTRKRENT
jgi:hypothetical protein